MDSFTCPLSLVYCVDHCSRTICMYDRILFITRANLRFAKMFFQNNTHYKCLCILYKIRWEIYNTIKLIHVIRFCSLKNWALVRSYSILFCVSSNDGRHSKIYNVFVFISNSLCHLTAVWLISCIRNWIASIE